MNKMSDYKRSEHSFDNVMKSLQETPAVSDFLRRPEVLIGNMVIDQRKNLGYSVQELAELSNTTVEQINSIEFGTEYTPSTLGRVFKALKIVGLESIAAEEAATHA